MRQTASSIHLNESKCLLGIGGNITLLGGYHRIKINGLIFRNSSPFIIPFAILYCQQPLRIARTQTTRNFSDIPDRLLLQYIGFF